MKYSFVVYSIINGFIDDAVSCIISILSCTMCINAIVPFFVLCDIQSTLFKTCINK